MEEVIIFISWFALNICSTSFVVRRRLPRAPQRFFYYALIWFMPFFGAAIAIFVSNPDIERSVATSDDAMFQNLIEKHRDTHSDKK